MEGTVLHQDRQQKRKKGSLSLHLFVSLTLCLSVSLPLPLSPCTPVRPQIPTLSPGLTVKLASRSANGSPGRYRRLA